MPARIRDILVQLDPLLPETGLGAVVQRFLAAPDVNALPVVFEGIPTGVVARGHIMDLFVSTQNRNSLLHQPVSGYVTGEPVLAEATAPVGYIAKQISGRLTADSADCVGVIAVEDGRYAGIVTQAALLGCIANENAARVRAMKNSMRALDKERAKSVHRYREQAELLGFLSHEIRTPLTGILGIADLLEGADLSDEAQDYARTISASGRHLNRLLGDFLDLSRLEVGKLKITPQPFRLSEFAHETRALWRGQSDQKGLVLKITCDDRAGDRVEGDPTRLRQILFNLVSNAMKFTEAGKVCVHLETQAWPDGQMKVAMTVADTGVGISDADKARLFEAFEQATPQTMHKYGGTGLGLSIAKGLTERMGGTIGLRDNPGGGAIFEVVCPVHKAGPRLATESEPRKRMANFVLGRILLVEDHEVSRLVISKALEAAGWQVDAVNTVQQGIRRASNVPYQAILSDLHLRDGSGYDLIRAVRSGRGPNRGASVLAVSADVSPSQRTSCIQAGFDGFIDKPIRPRDLVATLADEIMTRAVAPNVRGRLKAV